MDIKSRGMVWMVSGDRQVGKTRFCAAMAEQARKSGMQFAGLLSPGVYEGGKRTAILAQDLRSGEIRRLAQLERQSTEDLVVGDWFFDPKTLAWGRNVLEQSTPCDLLIIDELGPLELLRHEGWWKAIAILQNEKYNVALVVIRPELGTLAEEMLKFSGMIKIDQSMAPETWMQKYWSIIQEKKTRE